MNINQLVEMVLSVESDVSASFVYSMIEQHGAEAVVEWYLSEYTTAAC